MLDLPRSWGKFPIDEHQHLELRTLRGCYGRTSASRPLVMQSGSRLFDDIAMWNYDREAYWLSLYR